MCECHQWLWFHVDSVVVFSDSFTMINPVGTSRERRVCGSHADPEAGGIGVGVASWTRICFGCYSNLGQSAAERERERERERKRERERHRERKSADLIAPALSLFSQSATTLGLREAPHQEIRPISPMCAHTHAHTHTYTHTLTHIYIQGRGNVVTTALNREVRGYHYKWLSLTFSHSKGTLITHSPSDPEPLSLAVQHDGTSHGLRFKL